MSTGFSRSARTGILAAVSLTVLCLSLSATPVSGTHISHLTDVFHAFVSRVTPKVHAAQNILKLHEKERFLVTAFGHNLELELVRNKHLISKNYKHHTISFDESNNATRTEVKSSAFAVDPDNHCFYHGSVKGHPKSSVAVSLCGAVHHGKITSDTPVQLHGEIHVPNLLTLFLEPLGRHFHAQQVQNIKEDCNLASFVSGNGDCIMHHKHLSMDPLFNAVSKLWSHRAHPHLVYKPEHIKENGGTCGVLDGAVSRIEGAGSKHQHDPTEFMGSEELKEHFDHGTHMKTSGFFNGYKYVELEIINSFSRYSSRGTVADTELHSLTLANIVNRRYSAAEFTPEIRVVIIGQETFTSNDPWSNEACSGSDGGVDVDILLEDFNTWVNSFPGLPDFDNAQLLTSLDFCSTTVGYAGVGTMCTSSASGGIVQATYADQQSANIITHEMGHNFNMLHDGVDNSCDPSDYIMASAGCLSCSSFVTDFSSCSRTYIGQMLLYRPSATNCLENIPDRDEFNLCGDGILDPNEECDCGSSDCSSLDPCCDGSTCMLVSGAECSNSEPCCNNCAVRSATENFVCRSVVDSQCDQEEMCDGDSASCPLDLFSAPGTSCDSDFTDGGSGMCYKGGCITKALQCLSVEATLGSCNPTCSTLQCSYNGNCYSYSSDPTDGMPCGTGSQCLNGACVSSSLLEYQWDTVCKASCSGGGAVTKEVRCRSYEGTLVSNDTCINNGISPPTTAGSCASFAPEICSFTASPAAPTTTNVGDIVTLDWTIAGDADFFSLLIESSNLEWPVYLNVSILATTSNSYSVDFTIPDYLPPGVYAGRLIASISQENTSSTNFQIACQSGVNCIQGTCTSGECVCDTDVFGPTCNNTACYDGLNDCQNGATCNSGVCECLSGFSGEFCQTEVASCSGTCQNGGTFDSSTCVCECPSGYVGDSCENTAATATFTLTIAGADVSSETSKTLISDLVLKELMYLLNLPSQNLLVNKTSISATSSAVTVEVIFVADGTDTTSIFNAGDDLEEMHGSVTSDLNRMYVLRKTSTLTLTGFPVEEDPGIVDSILKWIQNNLILVGAIAAVVVALVLYKIYSDRKSKGRKLLAGVEQKQKKGKGGKTPKRPAREEYAAQDEEEELAARGHKRAKSRDEANRKRKPSKGKSPGKRSSKAAAADDGAGEGLLADFAVRKHRGHESRSPRPAASGKKGKAAVPDYTEAVVGDALPPNWTMHYLDDGSAFYFNSATDEVVTERPKL